MTEKFNLVFFYKALYGYVDLDNYVSFISHDRSRLTLNPSLLLVLLCRTTTFKNSHFNRTVIYGTQCVELRHLIAS